MHKEESMKTLALAGILGCAAIGAGQESQVQIEVVEYRHGDTVLQGYFAWKPGAEKRPGVIIFHEWKGHGEYVQRRARQVAELGYLAFAADMYGKGVFAKDHEEAARLMGPFVPKESRTLMRDRAKAGLEVLRKHKLCDATKIAAMGYCFGGTTSLEMARAGADLRGVASFHGKLGTPEPAKEIKPRVIVFHGKDDKFVPEPEVRAFEAEMKAAKANYEIVEFDGAVHSFTVKEAGDDPSKGMAYNENADKNSWTQLVKFLSDVFK
jgi:dienelactone hydrolase